MDVSWDPSEELAYLLQEAIHTEESITPSYVAPEYAAPEYAAPEYATPEYAAPEYAASQYAVSGEPTVTAAIDAHLEGLAEVKAEVPAPRPSSPGHRRRAPSRRPAVSPLQTASFFLAALAAAIVSMVSVFGGMVTYEPLRHIAEPRTAHGVVHWWPLLVYGPWLVASLSILRAALHQRRAAHSWSVVLLFSTVAMLLCVAQAPRSPVDVAAAALPSLAALACFQQLVRQITLTRPPRQAAPRHRSSASPTAAFRGQSETPA
ncbi:DUF2637 domain-containing protein [Streptomyces sp. NPDC051219]|uniref:DUF2637 domain-containing protein n=1 Tax=Streptomyces sp. NPDC051219 TaxID=3155283 RepID=UPI00341CCBD5